jgi:hypothetical protein
MKIILRCVLALLAVFWSANLLSGKSDLQAQSCCANNYCPEPPPNCPSPACDHVGGCNYSWVCDSPIIIDIKDQGFHLTDMANGVQFEFYGNTKQQVAWTDPKYSNGWLALDRNHNGLIDNATELFGNVTPQPTSSNLNGFRALAVYDLPENGGNNDGYITAADSIYPQLLVWTDTNHNGISEPNELQSLDQAGVVSIGLDYEMSRREDQYGNVFRYRSSISMDTAPHDHKIYDVYLVGIN